MSLTRPPHWLHFCLASPLTLLSSDTSFASPTGPKTISKRSQNPSGLVLEDASSYPHLALNFFAKLGKNPSRLSVNVSTLVVASSSLDEVALRWTQLGTSVAACPALKELCLHVPPAGQAHREGIVAMFTQPTFRNFPLRRIEIHLLLEGSDRPKPTFRNFPLRRIEIHLLLEGSDRPPRSSPRTCTTTGHRWT
ncbi:hypothetical protein C8Q76DRAFT_694843 [Earliella scabrosa]|nr:hypothetical protein C8Q76DRAFT_694843 [Earliella scabrosa]